MNINLLSLSNNKKYSHICVKYGSEDVYTAGKSANCDLTPNWAQFISAAGQRLYTIQHRRPISSRSTGDVMSISILCDYNFYKTYVTTKYLSNQFNKCLKHKDPVYRLTYRSTYIQLGQLET